MDSPVSNNGRGLKQKSEEGAGIPVADSPVSNNGRGLKLIKQRADDVARGIRPLAITGVD